MQFFMSIIATLTTPAVYRGSSSCQWPHRFCCRPRLSPQPPSIAQSSLVGNSDEVRALEDVFAEQVTIKRGVVSLRDSLAERGKRHRLPLPLGRGSDDGTSKFDADNDEDARSVATVTPGGLERVEADDEDTLAAAAADSDDDREERRQRQRELGRPRTPEPSSRGMLKDGPLRLSGRGFNQTPLDDELALAAGVSDVFE
jgi:hypothetical protein